MNYPRPIATSNEGWVIEIMDAYVDAKAAIPFAEAAGKTMTEDDDIIADVLFGRKKFVEIGKTQHFDLDEDNATEVLGMRIDPVGIFLRLHEKRLEIEACAESL